MERQAHRDREKEGDEFGDKEAYITPRLAGEINEVGNGYCWLVLNTHARVTEWATKCLFLHARACVCVSVSVCVCLCRCSLARCSVARCLCL